jgi:hypothetical protein
VDSYQYYGEGQEDDDQESGRRGRAAKVGGGVISGEQIIEQSDAKRGGQLNTSQNKKKTHVEVLDDERPIA